MERHPSWCYTCKKEIVPTEDFSCPTCLGGWVGPLEDSEQQNYAVPEAQPTPQAQPQPPPAQGPQAFQFHPGLNPFTQFFNFGAPPGAAPGNPQPNPGQFFAWGVQNPHDPNQQGQPQMPQFFQWGAMPGGPQPAQPGQPGAAPQPGVNFQAGPGVNVRRVVVNVDGHGGNIHELLNQAFQQLGIPFPVGMNPFQVGNDFPVAGGGNFQDILNQLFQQHNPYVSLLFFPLQGFFFSPIFLDKVHHPLVKKLSMVLKKSK